MIRDFISKIFQATLLKWGYGFEPQTDHGVILWSNPLGCSCQVPVPWHLGAQSYLLSAKRAHAYQLY